jgi:hypothetical protein
MRRVVTLLGIIMLVFGFSVLGSTAAQAATCNNDSGATYDDSMCPMHPDDIKMKFYELEQENDSLQTSVRVLQVGMVGIVIVGLILYNKERFNLKTRAKSNPKQRQLQDN